MFFSLSRYDNTLDVECLAVNDRRWGMLVQLVIARTTYAVRTIPIEPFLSQWINDTDKRPRRLNTDQEMEKQDISVHIV